MNLTNLFYQLQVKKYFLISGLGIGICFLLYYYFSSDIIFLDKNLSVFEVSLVVFSGIIISNVSYFQSNKMDDKMPWRTNLTNRFLAGITVHFISVFAIIVSMFLLYQQVKPARAGVSYQNIIIKLGILIFILILLYQIIYFALYSYYSFAITQIEGAKYERKQVNLQLKALKSQLSSHFLFNNLNTISALAFKDVHTSENYLRGMASVYQYSLNSYHSKLVSLEEELKMLRSYLLLLKTKYGTYFTYDIKIDDEILNKKVPPLTLQMLVENVVKHNVIDINNKLSIAILTSTDSISIKNNITQKPNNIKSFNIGLKNIESRYHLLIKKGITVSTGKDFIVEIPLIS